MAAAPGGLTCPLPCPCSPGPACCPHAHEACLTSSGQAEPFTSGSLVCFTSPAQRVRAGGGQVPGSLGWQLTVLPLWRPASVYTVQPRKHSERGTVPRPRGMRYHIFQSLPKPCPVPRLPVPLCHCTWCLPRQGNSHYAGSVRGLLGGSALPQRSVLSPFLCRSCLSPLPAAECPPSCFRRIWWRPSSRAW